MKRCGKCGQEKELSEFYNDQKGSFGKKAHCRECMCANSRKYYRENGEKQRSVSKAWKDRNKQNVLDYAKSWYYENIEAAKSRHKAWIENNKDHVRMYDKLKDSKDKADAMGCEGEFTEDEWKNLCERYGNRCLKCGREGDYLSLTVDHVVPTSRGGRNDITNIQPLCGPCNSSKRTKTTDYRY